MTAHEAPRTDGEEWELVIAELTAAMHQDASQPSAIPTDASSENATQSHEPLPAALAERIVGAGTAMVRGAAALAAPQASVASAPTRVALPTPVRAADTGSSSAWRQWGGWFAAAAVLIVAVTWPRPSTAIRGGAPDQPMSLAFIAQTLRDSLLVNDRAVARISWTTTADLSARGASGDVVWSARAQSGVMRLAGLQPNDRKRWQYQLWIFDKRRDQRYPVDGGVFDIPTGSGEVLIPINARVPVGEAIMFAITVEPAGGVVVSTRERIALLAKAGG